MALSRLIYLLLILTIRGEIFSPYPCVWVDTTTNDQLDLQEFTTIILSASVGSRDIDYIYYTPCNNNLIGTAGPSMSIYSMYPSTNQTLSIWDSNVIPSKGTDRWTFHYSDPSVECVSTKTNGVSFNVTWQSRSTSAYVSYPYVTMPKSDVTSIDNCHFSAIVQTPLLISDKCAIKPSSSTTISFRIFINHVFEYKIDDEREILYTPCNGLFICDNLYTQSILKNVSSLENNCDTYLALFVNAVSTRQSGSNSDKAYNNIYYNIQYDTAQQITQYLYKTGRNCTMSPSEIIERKFYVYWKCNTLAQPYVISSGFEVDFCTDQITIESIRACPNFYQCVYYDHEEKLNLTTLIGTNIVTKFDNDDSIWLFYSVCQQALPNKQTTKNITTLYNTGSIMAGEYLQYDNTIFYNLTRTASYDTKLPKVYYNQQDNSWLFQYTNGNLCSYNSLFSITWKCGGLSLYEIKEAFTSICTDSIVISTNLC